MDATAGVFHRFPSVGLQCLSRPAPCVWIPGRTHVVVHLFSPSVPGLVMPDVEVLATFHRHRSHAAAEFHEPREELSLLKDNCRMAESKERRRPIPEPLIPALRFRTRCRGPRLPGS